MRPSSITIPMNVFERNFIVYCPLANQEGGVLITRNSPIQFVFGFLKEHPTSTPFPEDYSLFDDPLSGFEWTCPIAYQEALLAGQITIKDVADDWEKLKTLRIDLEQTNFKPLSFEQLSGYFPKEQLVIYRPQSQFFEETKQVKELISNQNNFFHDRYDGQWFLNKMDDTRLYIIQVSYWQEKSCLKLQSDLYLMKEELLSYFDDYQGMKLRDLTLSDLIVLKNKTVEYKANQTAPKELEDYFTMLPKEKTAEWMNPANFYFDEVTA